MEIEEQINNVPKRYQIVTNGLRFRIEHFHQPFYFWKQVMWWPIYDSITYIPCEYPTIEAAKSALEQIIKEDQARIRGWTPVEL